LSVRRRADCQPTFGGFVLGGVGEQPKKVRIVRIDQSHHGGKREKEQGASGRSDDYPAPDE
jgi:hypothetical protein